MLSTVHMLPAGAALPGATDDWLADHPGLWDEIAWIELLNDVLRIRGLPLRDAPEVCGDCGGLIGRFPESRHIDDLSEQCIGRRDAAKRWPPGWFAGS